MIKLECPQCRQRDFLVAGSLSKTVDAHDPHAVIVSDGEVSAVTVTCRWCGTPVDDAYVGAARELFDALTARADL